MKITDLINETELTEGPILNKIGQGIGKAAGTAAKAVGAVAGGAVGAWDAAKKGFAAGKAQVSKAGDDDATATQAPVAQQPVATAAPAAAPKAKPTSNFAKLSAAAKGGDETPQSTATSQTPATDTSAQAPAAKQPAPQTTATTQTAKAAEPATAQLATGAAPAAQQTAQPKADTAYAQAQKAVAGLPPKQRQAIITMLQNDPKVQAAQAKQQQPAQKPAAQPAPAAQQQPVAAKPATVAPKTKNINIKGARPAAKTKPTMQAAGKEFFGNQLSEELLRKVDEYKNN